MAAVRRAKKRKAKAKRKGGAWSDEDLVRAAVDLHSRLGFFLWQLKCIAGKDPEVELSADELAKLYRPEQYIPSPPAALRIARDWLERSEAQQRTELADILTTLAANLACRVPGTDVAWVVSQAANARPDHHPAKALSVSKAIAKPRTQSDIGRALKVFNLLAEGAPCDPGPQANRAPRGALKTLLEAKIAMARSFPAVFDEQGTRPV